MTPPQLTKAVILTAAFVLLAYDAWAYLRHGREATISVVLCDWGERYAWVPVAFGLVGGHIFSSLLVPLAFGVLGGVAFWAVRR